MEQNSNTDKIIRRTLENLSVNYSIAWRDDLRFSTDNNAFEFINNVTSSQSERDHYITLYGFYKERQKKEAGEHR